MSSSQHHHHNIIITISSSQYHHHQNSSCMVVAACHVCSAHGLKTSMVFTGTGNPLHFSHIVAAAEQHLGMKGMAGPSPCCGLGAAERRNARHCYRAAISKGTPASLSTHISTMHQHMHAWLHVLFCSLLTSNACIVVLTGLNQYFLRSVTELL